MFQSIKYIGYNADDEYNSYQLRDTCFIDIIISPYSSPSLNHEDNKLANTLTMLSVAHYYNSINRNVALNLAHYYGWLSDACGFYIDKKFIHKQLSLLDLVSKNTNFKKKYYNNICHYLVKQHLLKSNDSLPIWSD